MHRAMHHLMDRAMRHAMDHAMHYPCTSSCVTCQMRLCAMRCSVT